MISLISFLSRFILLYFTPTPTPTLPSLFRVCTQCASSLCTPFNITYSTRTHCRAITTLFNYYFWERWCALCALCVFPPRLNHQKPAARVAHHANAIVFVHTTPCCVLHLCHSVFFSNCTILSAPYVYLRRYKVLGFYILPECVCVHARDGDGVFACVCACEYLYARV